MAGGRPGVTADFTPDLHDQVTEAVDDPRVIVEIGRRLDVADGSQPLRYSIEVAEFLLEGGDDRKTGQPRGPIALLNAEICSNHALDENGRAVDRRMTSNERKSAVHGDQLEVARRGHGFRQNETEFLQSGLDAAHRRILGTGSAPKRAGFPFGTDGAKLLRAEGLYSCAFPTPPRR